MTGVDNGNGERLDSWKAIAAYLGRDMGTVRRWEKSRGLPVHRVPGGKGSSVFAYTGEIDAWLQSAPQEAADAHLEAVEPAEFPSAGRGATPSGFHRWRWALAGLALAAAAAGFWVWPRFTANAAGLRAEVTPRAVTVFDRAGHELWSRPFDEAYATVLSGFGSSAVVDNRPPAVVYAATSYRERRADRHVEGGQLAAFTANGRPRWSFGFDETLTVGGEPFGAPWALTTIAVDQASDVRRVAVAAHHYIWSPSLVALLDEDGRRQATFAHAGWIESLSWLNRDRLVIGGFSESQNGGMVALLDPAAMNGQGPEPPGSRYACETCGPVVPLRMVVMPRSELNLATTSRFNRAGIRMVGDRIVVDTAEVPLAGDNIAEAIYEFSADLTLIRAGFGQRYWDLHATLEAQGKLDHSRAECPDRNGPREIFNWSPGAGWAPVAVRPADPGAATASLR